MSCTLTVVNQLRASDRIVATNDALGGDPAPGKTKILLVEVAAGAKLPLRLDEGAKPKVFESPKDVPSAPRWVAFIRHAQAGHNADPNLLEKPDNPLTELGREQAIAA